MFGGTGMRWAMLLGLAAMLAAASGCGGDDESTADEGPQVSPAVEPSYVFAKRLAKLLETTTDRRQCAQLDEINNHSFFRFSCPTTKELRRSMASFRVVGAEEYGAGAIVDYRSGKVEDGAAIVLFVAPDRKWGISRFGVVTKPSTKTSDDDARDGYAETVGKYIAAIRKRDCKAFEEVAFTSDLKGKDICKLAFARIKDFAEQVRRDPNARPKYIGGNESYGFFAVDTERPEEGSTISVVRSVGDSFKVLDAAPGPTLRQQGAVRQQFKQQKREQRQEQREKTEPVPAPDKSGS